MTKPYWLDNSQLEQAEELLNLGFEFIEDPEYEALDLDCQYAEVDHQWLFLDSRNTEPTPENWKHFIFWEVQAVCQAAVYTYIGNIDPSDFEKAISEYQYFQQIKRQAVEEVRHICDRQSGKQLVLAVADDDLDEIPF